MGRASPTSRGLSSPLASATVSTFAICARFRCAGRFAQPVPRRLWRGSHPALLLHRMARRDLWTPDCPSMVWNAQDVVDSAALRLWWPDGSLPLLWDMEDSRPAQDRRRGEACVAG